MKTKTKNVFFLSDEHTRSFGGKLDGFESKEERNFEIPTKEYILKNESYYLYNFCNCRHCIDFFIYSKICLI